MLERFVVGIVGAPFGVKGFVKVKPLSGEWKHISALDSITLRRGAQAERSYTIDAVNPAGAFIAIKFRGIDSPEAARELNGAELVTDREHAAALLPDEFYVEDMKGLTVVAEVELNPGLFEPIGEITDVLEGGGGQLVEIKLTEGGSRLVPFRKEFFGDIDIAQGRAILLCRWILE
ncbi:ribosome maturation factor RimM [Spirochaetia bacterium]|nr:ribosome maturation factor RimM [Spirochaetia bacterium]